MSIRIKAKQLTSGNQIQGKYLITDGNGGFKYGDTVGGILTGITFPTSPNGGDVFYRTDVDQLFHYDGSRSKWLSVNTSTYTCGRSSVKKNASGYMYIGSAVQSSTEGFLMNRNGTIISAAVDNAETMVLARDVEVRINDSTTNRVVLTIGVGDKGTEIINANVDFSSQDLIQVIAIANNSTDLNNISFSFEVAWRV